MTDAEFRRRILAVVAERDDRVEATQRERGRMLARIGAEVAVFVAANPGASANDVTRSVPGRRADVLQAVRELRAAQRRYQRVGYHVSAAGSDGEAEEPDR
jgi:hypothetical protein